MSALSTRTLKPSLGNSFVTKYLSCQEATLASHSQQRAIDLVKTTPDTSGLGLKTASLSCDQASVSLRMSTDTSRWDSPQSSATWKNLVTRRRGEFLARLKSVPRINANESSSWPTASTRDHKGGYSGGRIRNGKVSMDTLDVAVQAYSEGGLLAPEKPSTDGNLQELWRTPSSSDGEGGIMEMRPGTAGKYKLRDHVHANWATPNAGDFKAGISTGRKQKSLGQDVTLSLQNWATPNTLDHMALRSPEALLRQATTTRAGRTSPANLREQVDPASVEIYRTKMAPEKRKITHKLNPRFVETLMGLPIGWVMPNCAKPISTGITNSVPLAMESSPLNAPTATEPLLIN